MVLTGIIVKGIGGFYYVRCEDGEVRECKARGIFRKNNIKPMIGDRVEIEVSHGTGNILKIGERRNCLVRPPVSNVDCIMIVAAAKNPDPDFLLIDKMLVTSEKKGIKPIICINKTDLDSAQEFVSIYEKTGYTTITASTYDDVGIDEVKACLKGRVTAFAGLSGVDSNRQVWTALLALAADWPDAASRSALAVPPVDDSSSVPPTSLQK